MAIEGMQRLLYCILFSGILWVHAEEDLPPIHWIGRDFVFTGDGPDRPARLMGVERAGIRMKRDLGWPHQVGDVSGGVLWGDRLLVTARAIRRMEPGAPVRWELLERGLGPKDTWSRVREGRLPGGCHVRAFLPLSKPDEYLFLGWLPSGEVARSRRPVHRIRIDRQGHMKVLDAYGSDWDPLVRVLRRDPDLLDAMVVHGTKDGHWVFLFRSAGLGWVIDGDGLLQRAFSVSRYAVRLWSTPLYDFIPVVLRSQTTQDGKLWMLAQSEDGMQMAVGWEYDRKELWDEMVQRGHPESGARDFWKEAARRHLGHYPRYRWVELDPKNVRLADHPGAPLGGPDQALPGEEPLDWIPVGAGKVLPLPEWLTRRQAPEPVGGPPMKRGATLPNR